MAQYNQVVGPQGQPTFNHAGAEQGKELGHVKHVSEEIASKYIRLGGKVSHIFTLKLISLIAGIIGSLIVVLSIPANIAMLVLTIVEGATLIQMDMDAPGFSISGICTIIAQALFLVGAFFSGGMSLLFTIPAAILSIVYFITLVNNMKDTLSQIDPYLVYSWEKMKVLYILVLLGPVIIAVVVIVALAALPKSSSRLSIILMLMLAYLVLVIVSAVRLLKNLSATSDALIREASTIRQMIRKAEKEQH